VLTEIGAVNMEVPRDRQGTLEPQLERQRRLEGRDAMVKSLCAGG
jgi:putative transposase